MLLFINRTCVCFEIFYVFKQQNRDWPERAMYSTDMRRLTTGIRSEKCVVRRFGRCANVYLHEPRKYSLLHT
jgi:hypothetical protein